MLTAALLLGATASPIPAAAAPLTGQAVAAGENGLGELGDGTHDPHRAPVLIPALGNAVTQVAAGGAFGVALLADGTVWTWGYNGVGQLGDGTQSDWPLPRKVPNLSGIIQISAGMEHVLALSSDGTVWSWGGNSKGQVGAPFNVAIKTPTRVAGLAGLPVTQVSAGDEYSLAVGPNGQVFSWGDNYNGELGTGGTFDSTYFVGRARNLSDVVQVAAGSKHAVTVRSDGTVWQWGAIGALVYSVPQRVVELPPGITQVAAGGGDSFAVVSAPQGSSVWAWGSNKEGRLGDNTTVDRLTPVNLSLPDVRQIAARSGSTAVIRTDGTVWAWGANDVGQLGIDSPQAFVATPMKVPGLTNAIQVSPGYGSTLAVGTALPRVAVHDRSNPAGALVLMPLSAEGGLAPYAWTAANLPPGLSIDSSSGLVAGTPHDPSTFGVTVTATDQAGHAGSASFSWTITPPIVTVPNVVGLQKTAAIVAMKAVGLIQGSIASDNLCLAPAGQVLAQQPPAGPFTLVANASFNLTVSSGHDPRGKVCTLK